MLAIAWPALLSGQALSFRFPSVSFESGSSRATSFCNTCIAVADFNGDGKADLAYTLVEFTPFAGVLLGNGDGTFRSAVNFPENQASGRPIPGDFNGDGRQDIVLSGARTWLFAGNGDGSFAMPVEITDCATPSSLTPGISVAGDWNHDGKVDLICSDKVMLSVGDGTFLPSDTLGGDPVVAADFNADGLLDILVSAPDHSLFVAFGRGDGRFRAGATIVAPVDVFWAVPARTCAICFVDKPSVQLGDFNGDGQMDLAVPSKDNASLLVLPGRTDGSFGPAIASQRAPGLITAAGDFNHDGKLDLIAGDAVLAGNGDGTFRFPVFFGPVILPCGAAANPADPSFFPCAYQHVATAVADFDGNGLPDIATGSIVLGPQNLRVDSINILLNSSTNDGLTSSGVSSSTLTWPVGPNSIVSLFGTNLASAAVNPAPTVLGGIRVHVRDRSRTADVLAPLLYVSPNQINFVLPKLEQFAWISIERIGLPYVPSAMGAPITSIAPGFFTLADGWALGNTVKIAADSQVVMPLSFCNPAGCAYPPIDVVGSVVYLSLYGTGFAQASVAATNCTIAGQTIPISYAGPQTLIAGLDQLNVLLPRSLAGTGITSLSCSFNGGVFSNAVKLTIQ